MMKRAREIVKNFLWGDIKIEKGLKIAQIFNIDILLHWSFYLGFIYFVFLMAKIFQGVLSASIFSFYASVLAVCLIFFSVFLHEMAHARTALKNKVPVKNLVFFGLGGCVNISENDLINPQIEQKISLAGPLMNILIAAFYLGLFYLFKHFQLIEWFIFFNLFCWFEFLCAIFNLLPFFPLDGGRAFIRAPLWKLYKNKMKATKVAMISGVILIIILSASACIFIIKAHQASAYYTISLWLLICSWFIGRALYTEYRAVLAVVLAEEKVNGGGD